MPMKIKTTELTGAALDWAVAKATDRLWKNFDPEFGAVTGWLVNTSLEHKAWQPLRLARIPLGPLIDKYRVSVHPHPECWTAFCVVDGVCSSQCDLLRGDTTEQAIYRAIVAAELGPEVEIPEELK